MHYLWACSQPWICTKVNTTSKEQRKLICTHHVALIVSVKEHNLCLKLPILPFLCLGSILSVKPVKLITAVLSLSQERENSLIRLFIVQYRLWPLEAIGVGCLPKFFFYCCNFFFSLPWKFCQSVCHGFCFLLIGQKQL